MHHSALRAVLVARADLRRVWEGGDFRALSVLTLSGSEHPGWVAWSLNGTLWVSADVWANVKVECEPSWQPFQGHCYRLQAEKRSWQESKKACLRGGGDLLSIHSMAELEFITKQIKQGEGLLVHTPGAEGRASSVPILSWPRGPGTVSLSVAGGRG